ncbi:RCC1 domain-containing protein rug3, mitochondrial [Asimina triloba]
MAHRFCCRFFSSSSASSSAVPLLWRSPNPPSTTLEILSWGRGSSGQLGGGIEEIRFYPTPLASLLLPPNFRLAPVSGRLSNPEDAPAPDADSSSVVDVGISCGLFHSSVLVDGRFWIWGKGDGGRLGLGHENSVFVPTENPNLDGLRSIALGGLHSAALTTRGDVFTW